MNSATTHILHFNRATKGKKKARALSSRRAELDNVNEGCYVNVNVKCEFI